MSALLIPDGYAAYPLYMGYSDLIGPLYRRMEGDTEWFGLRIEQRHANRGPMAHGGLIATLADIVIGRVALKAQQTKRGCLSINLNVDYLRNAPLGSWLTASALAERIGSSIGFVSCRIVADDELVAQARGILKYLAPLS
jgi:uncharacterized protein (TIGR00369 family)